MTTSSLHFPDCDGADFAPTQSQSVIKTAYIQRKVSSPFYSAFSNAVGSQQSIAPSVLGLFGLSGPPHVAGFVMSCIVDPVKRMLRCRLAPHSLKKMFVRLKPKLDAASSVFVKCRVGGVITSAFGGIIRLVLGGVISDRRFTVCRVGLDGTLTLITPTRNNFTTAQMTCADSFLSAAFALAYPIDSPVLGAFGDRKNLEASKALMC